MVFVKLVNTNHGEFIREMLAKSLDTQDFYDTILHFPDSAGPQKTLRCHRTVLMSASPLLKGLLGPLMGGEESFHLSLPGVRLEDASRILSLIYKGSMQVPQGSIVHTSQVIELLRLKVQNSNNLEHVRQRRPLLMKTSQVSRPLLLVLPSSGGDQSLPPPPPKGIIPPSTISKAPQKPAKEDKKNRFTCDECGRGFSLACLLKRHKTIHSGIKPFKCVYCEKTFTSGSSLRHHEFSKHLDERIQRRKKLLSQKRGAAVSLKMHGGENSMDGSESLSDGMNCEESSPPVTVLDTSQTDMDTVIEIVDTSSASEDSGITTYSVRSSTPTENTPILYNVDLSADTEQSRRSRNVFWRLS